VVEVTDPAHPAPVGRWSDPQAGGGGGCAGTARLTDDGEGAVVVRGDGRVYDLDLTDPARPSASGPTEDVGGPARSVHAAVLPLGNRTIAIVSEEGCAEDTAAGERLRVLALERGIAPREEEPVEYPGAGGPGRLVASGALAYVAWHGAGMRVVDFGEVKARTVAQFAPDHADVVGVALLPEHVVVTDASLGLYVLARPDEGGGRAGFWSQFLSLLPYMVLPLMATAFVLVPRLAARGAPATGRVPAPSRRRVA
jgi:hypothetical protein